MYFDYVRVLNCIQIQTSCFLTLTTQNFKVCYRMGILEWLYYD